ncbi:Bbp16 family capsid cement protein [Nitratireductor rhodophyticola]|uniref:Bbp16 family capsid cement protein n=1 Tax=Nitratireductor rhodophyticola TaxID=2854036 RepID=UPI003BAACCD8
MIFDQTNLLSDAQAITATAPSTNVIDLSPIASGIVRDIGKGTQIPLLVQVVEDFDAGGAATLTVSLQIDSDEAFGTAETVWTSPATDLAELKAGKVFIPEYVPRGTDKRYMRLNYAVATGPMTAGKITAGVTMGNQSNG